MKKGIFFLLTIMFFIISFFILKNHLYNVHIDIKNKGITYKTILAGIKGAKDFSMDESNIYIAYKDKIQIVERNGKSYILFSDHSLNIGKMAYSNNKLYFLSGSSLKVLNLKNREIQNLINDLPNFGDYKDSQIIINGDNIFLSIGSATNSGVVGEDNLWIKQNPYNCDISPKNITIGSNIKAGAFVPYNSKNISGQIISGHIPGNASIISYNIKNSSMELYCWGVRDVKGMDFNSNGILLATVGGMEPRGERPISGDVDYIYELKKGIWYGWPDYSGGDPITSPRFKGKDNGKVDFLLKIHPSSNPPAPLYQNKTLSTLTELAVDKEGVIGEKDCTYFLNSKDNIIYSINNKGILNKNFTLYSGLNIGSMKICNQKFYLMDSVKGILVSISKA